MKCSRSGCALRVESWLRYESLEPRYLLSGIHGADAPYGDTLSVSFLPDGTDVLGQASSLGETFADAPVDWQQEIARAIESWAEHLGYQVLVVADDSPVFGDAGHVQVAAVNMADDVVASAIALRNDAAGDWAGTILFNSNAPEFFDTSQELRSVTLHEAGHIFGLEHSDDPNSVMFAYANLVSELTAADMALLELERQQPSANDPAPFHAWSDADVDVVLSAWARDGDGDAAATLELSSTQVVHFSLPADSDGILVHDADGVLVAEVGTNEDLVALLQPGTYTVTVRGAPPNSLDGDTSPHFEVLDRHLDPEIDDPSGTPITPCAEGTGEFCYPDEIQVWDTLIWVDNEWVLQSADETQPPLTDPGWWVWYIELISG